jgi:hypothetical protein
MDTEKHVFNLPNRIQEVDGTSILAPQKALSAQKELLLDLFYPDDWRIDYYRNERQTVPAYESVKTSSSTEMHWHNLLPTHGKMLFDEHGYISDTFLNETLSKAKYPQNLMDVLSDLDCHRTTGYLISGKLSDLYISYPLRNYLCNTTILGIDIPFSDLPPRPLVATMGFAHSRGSKHPNTHFGTILHSCIVLPLQINNSPLCLTKNGGIFKSGFFTPLLLQDLQWVHYQYGKTLDDPTHLHIEYREIDKSRKSMV